MELHELFSTAVEDLPDAPDLLPNVERTLHRRTVRYRVGAVAATSALVVGVGAVTMAAPWSRHAEPATHASVAVDAPNGSFPQQLIDLLQAHWPIEGQKISWDPAGGMAGTSSAAYNQYWAKLSYTVKSSTSSYNLQVRFFADTPDAHPLPESTVCPPSQCWTGANGWDVSAPAGTNTTDGVAYVMHGGTSISSVMVDGVNVPSESQLRQLLSSQTWRQLYQLAVDDGMTTVPPIPNATPSAVSNK